MRYIRRLRTGAAVATLLAPVVLIACSNDESADAESSGGSSISITEPAKDAKVKLPFSVKIKAGEELGPTESGKHHVHLWLDNDSENYLVVESDAATVSPGMKATLSGKPLGLAPGKHVIHISLRNANHSAAGAETEIPIELDSGTGPAPSVSQTSSEPPDYGNGNGY
ncbi:hypothetical protein [Kribbella sp. VKM Ac-2566]|uniref:hypothetical protein n=1 Tax=Kribbella sp. VKM Ac-2566 TaxID=2512218 RepID=UPI0010623FBE|nr:hypothetical protein [Kribbella sp. VKM Ac-2566]TDX04050.1 hypothetical protein EV647_2313 [Kribbella sp. VKM Ac-2566]